MKSNQTGSISGSDNVVKTGYKYSDLTGRIIGCAMEVHKILGNGFTHIFNLYGLIPRRLRRNRK